MRPTILPLLVVAALLPLACSHASGSASSAEGSERLVLQAPADRAARGELAESYASQGLIEEAVAQYLAILKQRPDDEHARTRAQELIGDRMPAWLPAEADDVAPFPHTVLDLRLTDPRSRRQTPYRLLRTDRAFFTAGNDVLPDPVHHWRFLGIDYGYLWNPAQSKWVMKVRAYQHPAVDASLARDALTAVLTSHVIASHYGRFDPTRPHGEPIDLWLTTEGKPGGESVGRNLYLTAVETPRSPAEWLREIVHEYGHIAFPGMGGFAQTDDPWVDGDLGELLLIKWAAANGQPPGLTWPLQDAEAIAAARRRSLIAKAKGKVNLARLKPHDRDARDYFLGLALRVEAAAGPRFLAEALARCPHGKPTDFIAAANALAKERGITLWR
jgi:hypothetical protein